MTELDQIPQHDDSLLQARNVQTGYGDLQVLADVTVDVFEDEIVLIFGPNGAGKSTFMRAAYRLLDLWNGNIAIHGASTKGLSTQEMINRGVCYVPQRENIFPNLTVEENLDIGGIHATDKDQKKDEMYELFPVLNKYRDRKVEKLSGGEQQMAAIARALMVDPELLLIDEPSAGLAPQIANEMLEHIKNINEAGTAIMMIEQNVRSGLEVADRAYALDQGQTRYEGPASEMLHSQQIRDLYI